MNRIELAYDHLLSRLRSVILLLICISNRAGIGNPSASALSASARSGSK
jgi:hypothetical protein